MQRFTPFVLSALFLVATPAIRLAAAPAPETTAPAAVEKFWPADGVFPVPGKTSSWSEFRAHNQKLRTLFAAHKSEDQDAIVFVGDSITEGWNTLKQDFADLGVKVVNRGIGGDTTPNLVYRIQEDVLSLHPRALVILIGTNDLGEHTPPEQIADNCRVLLGRIRAAFPKIPIAWCLVMPRRDDDTYPERIHELNNRIRDLAKTDSRITLCDTFTPLAQADGSSIPGDFKPDRLHLNAAGYDVWQKTIEPVLEDWHLNSN